MKKYCLLFLLLLAGCASLSQNECRRGDWRGIGERDGAAGRTQTYLAKHRKACARWHIAPDAQQWETGRQEGLKSYCTAENFYRLGRNGLNAQTDLCAPEDTENLREAHLRGYDYYRLYRELREQQNRLFYLEHRLDRLYLHSRNAEDDGARSIYLGEMLSLRRDIWHAEWEIRQLRHEIRTLR